MTARIMPDELLAFLGGAPVAQTPLAHWLSASPRLGVFIDGNEDIAFHYLNAVHEQS